MPSARASGPGGYAICGPGRHHRALEHPRGVRPRVAGRCHGSYHRRPVAVRSLDALPVRHGRRRNPPLHHRRPLDLGSLCVLPHAAREGRLGLAGDLACPGGVLRRRRLRHSVRVATPPGLRSRSDLRRLVAVARMAIVPTLVPVAQWGTRNRCSDHLCHRLCR